MIVVTEMSEIHLFDFLARVLSYCAGEIHKLWVQARDRSRVAEKKRLDDELISLRQKFQMEPSVLKEKDNEVDSLKKMACLKQVCEDLQLFIITTLHPGTHLQYCTFLALTIYLIHSALYKLHIVQLSQQEMQLLAQDSELQRMREDMNLKVEMMAVLQQANDIKAYFDV